MDRSHCIFTARGGASRHARAVFLFASILSLLASGCHTTSSRCGMPAPCAPVVTPDPFPGDRHVPPKGVDPGHSGYTETQWRVLAPRAPLCCAPTALFPPVNTEPAELIEQLPAPVSPSDVPETPVGPAHRISFGTESARIARRPETTPATARPARETAAGGASGERRPARHDDAGVLTEKEREYSDLLEPLSRL